ncbi:hypothetical protein F4820DRAFT_425017 [Hypoxylon rubiginosum]|uniref:Uncharacterized protein n=1 Tax=Hypoxylon rubiginosum TaxID=110542 RepID=A0ACB9YX11_9PEZI|nr:hypothetical protein F4820DRAFT_425017 [Hypoxylon rubiginosum]
MRTLQIHREDVMFRSWKDDNDIGGMSSQWNKQFSDVPRHDFGLNQATCDCYRMLSPVSPSLSQRDNHHNEELHSSKYSMETERLVPSTSDFEFNSDPIQRRSSHGSRIRCATPWILLFTVTLLWAGSYLQLRATYESSHQSPYSPAQHLIQYEQRQFFTLSASNPNEYSGPPSPELDKNWEDLYSMGIVAISRYEAERLPNKTSMLPHDEQQRYVVGLDVFHALHCLNMIRKLLHPEYYSEDDMKDINQSHDDLHHIDHCIEYLRQSVTCSVDLAPIPFQVSTRSALTQIDPLRVPDCVRCPTALSNKRVVEWCTERISAFDECHAHLPEFRCYTRMGKGKSCGRRMGSCISSSKRSSRPRHVDIRF